jgi:hypothetical protein
MNISVLETFERGYVKLDWSEYINRVQLTLEHMETIVDMIDTFKLSKSAKELVIFRFENIPAYITIKKNEYLNLLNWIYDKALELEIYELCKKVVDVKTSL